MDIFSCLFYFFSSFFILLTFLLILASSIFFLKWFVFLNFLNKILFITIISIIIYIIIKYLTPPPPTKLKDFLKNYKNKSINLNELNKENLEEKAILYIILGIKKENFYINKDHTIYIKSEKKSFTAEEFIKMIK
jgi:hypothetical protein